MREVRLALIALIVVAVTITSCDGDIPACGSNDPADPEPFALSDYLAGAEYAIAVEVIGERRAAGSCGLVTWPGIVRSHEWQLVAPPLIGEEIEITVRDTVQLAQGQTVIAVVDNLSRADGLTRLSLFVLDEHWLPAPVNLEPAVGELEAAVAATAISDRRAAVLEVVDEMAR